MKRFVVATLGAAALSISVGMMMVEPAFALGACGFNFHRNAYGRCVFGGQNQNWCLRHRGHTAGYGSHGTRWC